MLKKGVFMHHRFKMVLEGHRSISSVLSFVFVCILCFSSVSACEVCKHPMYASRAVLLVLATVLPRGPRPRSGRPAGGEPNPSPYS